MSSLKTGNNGADFWRSLEDKADTPEFREWAEKEFPEHISPLLNGVDRRGFLKLMGASLALAGLGGCRWPKEEIRPYASRPENRDPGVPARYATCMDIGGAALGLLVTSVDGRPIKIEGNPEHPSSLGSTDAWAQASVLGLYDPDRSRRVLRRESGQESTAGWEDFAAWAGDHFNKYKANGGRGLKVLSEEFSSPTLHRMRQKLLGMFPEASWEAWNPLTGEVGDGLHKSLARELYRFDKAEVIVSLDADFLGTHPNRVRWARDFAETRRAVNGRMSRLYVLESGYSLTGAQADERLAATPQAIDRLGFALLERFQGSHGSAILSAEEEKTLGRIVADLQAAHGKGLVLAGDGCSAGLTEAVLAINRALGNYGRTVSHCFAGDSLPSTVSAVENSAVDTLIVLGGNPAFDAPGFAEVIKGASTVIRLGAYEDETSAGATWHLPEAHYLEAWSDGRAWDGAYSIAQPLIRPLFDGKTAAEMISVITDGRFVDGHELVRETARTFLGAFNFEPAWRKLLHDGFKTGSSYSGYEPMPEGAPHASAVKDAAGFTAVFKPDYSLADGRFANNSWLQETPDPLTRLTWDNAALISPADAKEQGLKHGDMITIKTAAGQGQFPVFLMPGQARKTITLNLGYGRRFNGRVAEGSGFDAYPLRSANELHWAPCEISKTGMSYQLAGVQDHHAIDKLGMEERARRVPVLVREATLDEYKQHPEFARHVVHHPPLKSPWEERGYEGHKWGMSIDLSACIGCNACAVACQAENNVPVVGKDQVAKGREMSWIRVDRYFKGDEDAPEVVHQPVACHHCELAPCESVCPVAATMHSDEGLNEMIYNRCVGTRYCSNNCPYKVRRFNYHHYSKPEELAEMQQNPEVTVRSRGVMEKCTYCVQRIKQGKSAAAAENRPLKDGEIVPACAQACPTRAIVFGDLNDPNSEVAKMQDHNRSYAMLGELNLKPRTKYLARLKNPAEGGDKGGHGEGRH